MQKTIFFTIYSCGVLLLAACTQTPERPIANQLARTEHPIQTLTGYLYTSADKMTFTACDNATAFTVTDSSQGIAQRVAATLTIAPCPNQPLWAQIQAKVFPGNVLNVVRVDSLADLNKFNACRGFEYVCSGTEPFWQVLISPADQSVYFKDIGMEKGYTFDYSPPTTTNGTVKYTFKQRGAPEQTLQVVIKKETCSDGMSDNRYPYSSEIKVMGKTLKGCAETSKEMATQ